jgi:hypothetical protein
VVVKGGVMDSRENRSINRKETLVKRISELKHVLVYQKEIIKNLKNSEKHCSLLFNTMLNGFAFHEVI